MCSKLQPGNKMVFNSVSIIVFINEITVPYNLALNKLFILQIFSLVP